MVSQILIENGDGLNDPQLCVRSNAWDPLLVKMRNN